MGKSYHGKKTRPNRPSSQSQSNAPPNLAANGPLDSVRTQESKIDTTYSYNPGSPSSNIPTELDAFEQNQSKHNIEPRSLKSDQLKVCYVCKIIGTPEVRLLRCARCHTAWYCTAACQKADWKAHKNRCDSETAVRTTFASKVSTGSNIYDDLHNWLRKNGTALNLAAHSALVPHRDYLKQSGYRIDSHFLFVKLAIQKGIVKLESSCIRSMEELKALYPSGEFERVVAENEVMQRDMEKKQRKKFVGTLWTAILCVLPSTDDKPVHFMRCRPLLISQENFDTLRFYKHDAEWQTTLKRTVDPDGDVRLVQGPYANTVDYAPRRS